ncbi:MAG: hypothetical protein R3A47_02850 [Polyangiales bacterium]
MHHLADKHAKKFVVQAMGDSRLEVFIPALAALVDGDDPNDAACAIDALARIGGSQGI